MTFAVIEHVRYRISGDRRADFESACAAAAKELDGSADCVEYELTQDVEEPDGYVLRTTWSSTDGHRRWHDGEPSPGALSQYADDIQDTLRLAATSVRGYGSIVPTLYEWAGGAPALERLTTTFYARVACDELIGPLFARMDAAHPRFVAMWLAEVFGGPDRYTRERGGYANMLGHHVGKAITEPQRRRWVQLMLDAADEAELPADPEFRAAFVGYLEWGTRLALENSRPGAQPVRQAPVPRWGWGVAQPFTG